MLALPVPAYFRALPTSSATRVQERQRSARLKIIHNACMLFSINATALSMTVMPLIDGDNPMVAIRVSSLLLLLSSLLILLLLLFC